MDTVPIPMNVRVLKDGMAQYVTLHNVLGIVQGMGHVLLRTIAIVKGIGMV